MFKIDRVRIINRWLILIIGFIGICLVYCVWSRITDDESPSFAYVHNYNGLDENNVDALKCRDVTTVYFSMNDAFGEDRVWLYNLFPPDKTIIKEIRWKKGRWLFTLWLVEKQGRWTVVGGHKIREGTVF